MKKENIDVTISILIILLIASGILNIVQDRQIDRLIDEVKSLEYTQEIMSAELHDMENSDSLSYDD